jgi:hypothetical protein
VINDKCSTGATQVNSLGVSKAYHNHPSKILIMNDQFDHSHKKTIARTNHAILNLTQEGYEFRTFTAYIFLHPWLGLIMAIGQVMATTIHCMKNCKMLLLRTQEVDSIDE